MEGAKDRGAGVVEKAKEYAGPIAEQLQPPQAAETINLGLERGGETAAVSICSSIGM